LQIQQVTLSDDQPSNIHYDQASLQWNDETAGQQKKNIHSTGNALQSITSRLNEPLHIELMTDGSMLPGGEQQSQCFAVDNTSEKLGPPHRRVCVLFGVPY